MLKGRGKEIELEISDNYNVLIGTVDNKNPKSIYYKISCWGQPISDDDTIDYSRVVYRFAKNIKSYVYSEIDCEVFDCDITILDFDMRVSGVKYGKKSFMSCEITLFQINELPITSDKIKDVSEVLLNKLLKYMYDSNEYFEFQKKKK
jgi:hypothetical protein